MAKPVAYTDMKYDDSMLIDVESMPVAAAMLDKLARLKDVRRRQPLDMTDNIVYDHRYLYDEYNLQIGDSDFMIPPEFIMVTSESSTQTINTIRQENSQKMKSGYHKRTILIDLVFNGMQQLNGFTVDGPEGTYYVDGLRSIMAQFKCAPFLPIMNETINGTYGIFTVALQSITISTVNGFPNVMKAQLNLQEVNLTPYLEVPNFMFRYMIDWDLFRFYYQRFLTENHEYRKLQSLPTNKDHTHFRVSILNPAVFDGTVTSTNLLNIITDKYIVCKDEDGNKAESNFLTYIDSAVDDAVINEFQCGYSNMLANIQMSEGEGPTLQFMGGMDTIYNISFETKDRSVVQALEQCQVTNDLITRNNIKYRSLGFVKLESELVEFTGSLFVMIDSVTTNTVPGFPGLYNVQINCVSFDIAQSEREQLNGFMPFECTKEHPHEGHTDQAIKQSWEGVETKATQDNYAEWKIRTTMEVYPDMHLPTYQEVNDFVDKCAIFRAKNGLSGLPYTKYPLKPSSALFGNNPNNTISVDQDIFYASEISIEAVEYNIFVDPDFYVFYFNPYGDDAEEYEYEIPERESVSKTHVVTVTTGDDFFGYGSSLIERMIAVAKTQLGRPYSWGGDGENQWGKRADGLAFDCSGFITWILKQVGLYSGSKMGATGIYNAMNSGVLKEYFEQVPWESRQRGDIVLFSSGGGSYGHCGIIVAEGEGKDMIHASGSHDGTYAMGSRRGPNDVVKYGDSAKDGRTPICFRLRSQYRNSSNSAPSITTSGTENAQKIWSGLKSIGMSDIAAASIMGNMMAECTLDPDLFEKSNGRWSKSNLPYNKGYGLIQWTNTNDEGTAVGRRDKFMNYFDNDYSRYSTIEGQLEYLVYECTIGPDSSYYRKFWDKTMNATSISEGVSAFLNGIEGLAKDNKYWAESLSARIKYAQDFYNQFAGQSSFGDPNSSIETQPEDVLMQSEFDQICRVVMATTEGEGSDAQKACAQVIYDMLTDPLQTYGDLPTILSTSNRFASPDDSAEIPQSVIDICHNVFCEGDKYWEDKRALDLISLDPSDTVAVATYSDRKAKWPEDLGTVGQHNYFGRDGQGSDIQYIIVPDGTYQKNVSGTVTTENTVDHERYCLTMEHIKYFGEPTIARTSKMMKEGSANFITNELNHGVRRYCSAFCDMYQYSARGTLLRAFPAFLFCILDDQAQWYDGRKLWTNYYVYKSVVDIQVHAANDMPIENATITITNSYHNLDQTKVGMSEYNVANDPRYDSVLDIRRNIYKMTGLMLGGLELTPTLIQMHQIIYDHARLREGARIHLRIGYGSDPLSLAPVMNGHISDITLGDQITMVVTSDGHELISHITSSKEKDTNNGFLGLFGLFEDQESSNIIANVMCQRQSWVNHLCKNWFEASEFGIEHYGIFCWEGFGDVINKKDQYDMLKNLYVANYGKDSYVTGVFQYFDESVWDGITNFFGGDGEKNVVFNQYNMTPWDVFQVCTQQVPEYIFKSSYHQFDSRIYFGLPFWMEKCRYDWYKRSGKLELYEECKSASQVFYCDSITNIIDNQVRVTSKYSTTNVKVMYTLGGTTKTTDLLRSDSTIDFAYQKTAIIDSPIVQDALGPDAFYEFSGIQRTGYDSAVRIGTSALINGWQQEYQGGLILNGTPGLKPNDHLMLNDTFASTYGLCFAREVIHSFSTMSGYTTTVVPGMIAFATAQNSGNIEQMQNYLSLLNSFAYMTAYRKTILDTSQQNLSLIANLIVLQDKYDRAVAHQQTWHMVGVIGRAAVTFAKGAMLYKALGSAEKILHIVSIAKDVFKAFKTIKTAGNIISGILEAANVIKTAGVFSGPGIIISVIIQIVEILVRDLLLWIEHQNMVCLMPLWWENYPFVSGVKDGEKILIMGSNSTATGECDQSSDAIDTEVTRFD